MKNGRRFGAPPKPYQPASPLGQVNLTDPDSHLMKTSRSFVRRLQRTGRGQQIVLAAEICTEPVDFSSLGTLITATLRELEHAGIAAKPEVAVADAGFWNERQMDELAGDGILR